MIFDTNDGQPEGLRNWMKRIPEEGVTAILPTTVTQMPDVLTRAVANVAAVVKEGYEGAEILGIHFEGPFLDMEYKGAQPPEAIASASVEQFKISGGGRRPYQIYHSGAGRIRTMRLPDTVPPTGVVSMGHSAATYEQALGIANGAYP